MTEILNKIKWKKTKKGYKAELETIKNGKFKQKSLSSQEELKINVTNEKRCTGYYSKEGKRKTCPKNNLIEKGAQCYKCRNKDKYRNYKIGNTDTQLKGDFAVYLAHIGNQTKVGVTKSKRLEKRWIEQGADYAAKIKDNLTSEKALETEKNITKKHGIKQRINKKHKLKPPSKKQFQQKINKLDCNQQIINVQNKTLYEKTRNKQIKRKGLINGKIQTIKGQIIVTQKTAIAITSGKTIKPTNQNSLKKY